MGLILLRVPQYHNMSLTYVVASVLHTNRCGTNGMQAQSSEGTLRQESSWPAIQARRLVWLHTPAVPRGQSKKLHRPCTGPYRIVAKLSDAVYRIQHSQARRKHLVVHFDWFKPCPQGVRLPTAVEGQAMEGQSRATTFPQYRPWVPL